MAYFPLAFDKTMHNEGGYKLHEVVGDPGGITFAGISRRYHPDWPGWVYVDIGNLENPALPYLVFDFFEEKFWGRINGDVINGQAAAETIYDFAVNKNPHTALRLAQIVLKVDPDGIAGPLTIGALNTADQEDFSLRYGILKMVFYNQKCWGKKVKTKFLHGWLDRTLRGIVWNKMQMMLER